MYKTKNGEMFFHIYLFLSLNIGAHENKYWLYNVIL